MKRSISDKAPFDRRIEDNEQTGNSDCLLVLQSLHLSEFATLFVAMEQFYDGFELCDHSVNFIDAANILEKAAASFPLIDKDSDNAISFAELQTYAARHPESNSEIEWLECHYQALTQASLAHHNGIRRQDLETARRVFHGLDFVLQHFSHLTAGGSSKIYPEDLLRLVCCRENLTQDEALGIWHLIHYLMHLRKTNSIRSSGLTPVDLQTITPERLWLQS